MKKKKILVWEPIQHSACAFYRSKGVLEFLNDEELEFTFLRLPQQVYQHDLFGYDAVMVNRSYDPQGETLVDWAKQLGLGVIVDYDDDLFNVEPDNEKAYPVFSNPVHQNHVRSILSKSDPCTVTTEGLALSYKRYAKNVAIIPNAFNDEIFDVEKAELGRNKIVLWRGGESHRLEIAEYAPAIIKVMKRFPEWKFVSMGFKDFNLIRKLGHQAHHQDAMDLIPYFHHLKSVVRPAVTIVPLRDNVFNSAKSNIAWQETTWAGSVNVLTNQYQWRDLPAYIYGNVDTFQQKMEEAIVTASTKVDTHTEKWTEAVKELKANWLLTKINPIRAEIYKKLFR